jgi:Molybdopterin oxidoreductase
VRYPYVRGPLLDLWREARARLGDPVAAWAEITGDPARAATYKTARGMGGFVRSTSPEVTELIVAAHVHTIRKYGPDRVIGFSPIPAMSQVSYAIGIAMGATAITVLAGARIVAMASAPAVDATRHLIAGSSVLFWELGTWLFPPEPPVPSASTVARSSGGP